MYVVLYSHRHGADIWTSATETEAWLSACIELWQYIMDVESDSACKEIAKLILAKDYANAAESLAGYLQEIIEVRKVCQSDYNDYNESKFRDEIEEWLNT